MRRVLTHLERSLLRRLRRSLGATPRRRIWLRRDLADLGPAAALGRALRRLVATGRLTLVLPGLYYAPRWIAELGCWSVPAGEEIMAAIAKRTGEVITLHGARWANLLGLTEQVPTREIYWTTGRSRDIAIGLRRFELRHLGAEWMQWAGRPGAGVVLALLAEGPHQAAARTVRILHDLDLPQDVLQDLREGLPTLPPWMARIVTKVLSQSLAAEGAGRITRVP